jgi:hypothetical protein
MFSYSKGYYVSPPDDQYLKFKNRCSLLHSLAESVPWNRFLGSRLKIRVLVVLHPERIWFGAAQFLQR